MWAHSWQAVVTTIRRKQKAQLEAGMQAAAATQGRRAPLTMTAEAGLVPWADTGMMHTLRCWSPRLWW